MPLFAFHLVLLRLRRGFSRGASLRDPEQYAIIIRATQTHGHSQVVLLVVVVVVEEITTEHRAV